MRGGGVILRVERREWRTAEWQSDGIALNGDWQDLLYKAEGEERKRTMKGTEKEEKEEKENKKRTMREKGKRGKKEKDNDERRGNDEKTGNGRKEGL